MTLAKLAGHFGATLLFCFFESIEIGVQRDCGNGGQQNAAVQQRVQMLGHFAEKVIRYHRNHRHADTDRHDI